MASTFNLVDELWIPVLATAGMGERSLSGVFDPDALTVASGDPLEDAAVMRLLLAIQIAADRAACSPQVWLADHRARFDLLDPVRPFWQNPDMARHRELPKAVIPADLAYRHVGRGKAAVNLRQPTGDGVQWASAARLLLVRQMFSTGGMQTFTSVAYGKAPMSATTSVATNRPALWLDTGTVAGSLAATAALTADSPEGTFWFGWPDDAVPAQEGTPTGVLDALTWQSRSMLLVPGSGGGVSGVMICDGIRWPERVTAAEQAAAAAGTAQRAADTAKKAAEKKAHNSEDPELHQKLAETQATAAEAHAAAEAATEHLHLTAQHEQMLNPYTLYTRKKPTAPFVAHSVHSSRPVWRQLATAMTEDDNPLTSWHEVAAAHPGARWQVTGLGSFQGGISGAMTGSVLAAADPAMLRAYLEYLTDTYQKIGSVAGSLAHAVSAFDGYGPVIPSYEGLASVAQSVAEDLAGGWIDLAAAQAALDVAAHECTEVAYRAVRRVRPADAGRVYARKATAAQQPTSTTKKKVTR